MSGKRYLLDTNAVIALLKGEPKLINCLKKASWIGVSIISCLEFLAFTNLSENDKELFENLIERLDVIDLASNDEELIARIITIRQQYKLKLPDAIVVSSAIENNAFLITEDRQLNTVKEVTRLSINEC